MEPVKKLLKKLTAFDKPEWPFSDRVTLCPSATENQVMSWFPDTMKSD